VTPIFETSTFGFVKAAEVGPAMAGEKGFVYSRWDNPTVVRLERKLAALEKTGDGAAFGSGMAAISTTVFSLIEKGSHVVGIRDLYGGTFALLSSVLPRLGIQTTLVNTTSFEEMADAVKESTKAVLIETPTNPTLKLVDIARVAKLAHGVGALLLVDNTFASPVNQTPIALGADVVLHSATKFLNGHADVVAGAAVASEERAHAIKMMRRELGGTLDPLPAWLVLRGMKTMAIRVRQQNAAAQVLAEFLAAQKKVKAVNYPGLKTHPQHSLARSQMKGSAGC